MTAVSLGVLGASAGATEPDKSPPVVTLSGAAVKAVEEGKSTGTYELHIAATDGSKAAPQSGVAKIEVGVDGSGQQSWEKYCPEGSCALEQSWTYSPATFSSEFPRWITVKVTDHAGNTTEEEISIEGLEEVPREAAPSGADTTAPTISFSGSAVEALETGATSGKFELRMFAKDGTPTAPQSGIAKVEIGIDGTMLQSWEKYCPVGSCRLKQQWTYSAANYPGTGHVMTIVVHDHAGNVTTRTIGPDATRPVIELSGPLTEGLKEGITAYPLHVHATDGNAENPQSGVKSVSIAVDGTVVKTAEQPCPEGNCVLNLDWTYETSKFPGDHSVTVAATDQVGNAVSQQLSIIEPDGSIPACGPTGEQRNGTPDEVKALPGGGSVAIYHEAEGVDAEFPTPPANFEPLGATAAELEEYGYPPRPGSGNVAALERWKKLVAELSPETLAAPGGCVSLAEGNAPPAGGVNENEILTPTFSGVAGRSLESTEWTGISDSFVQPAARAASCPATESMSSWVGLGGKAHGFLQAGTVMSTGPAGRPHYHAFTERFFSDEPAKLRKIEYPMTLPIEVKAGWVVSALVRWNAKSEKALMLVGAGPPGAEHLHWGHSLTAAHKPGLYYGGAVEFIGAERPTELVNGELGPAEELMPFENYEIVTGEVEQSDGFWIPMSSLEPESVYRMQNTKEGKPTGQVMANVGNLGAKSFKENWQHCHP